VAAFFIGVIQVSLFGIEGATDLGFVKKSKEKRRSSRRSVRTNGWIRMDGAFAVLPCKVHDISNNGVRITLDRLETVSGEFTFMMSRNGGSGRRARLKWRRGLQIGAEFM
jgi:hypothetical protein